MEYRSGHFQFDVSAPANDNACNVHKLQQPAPDYSNLLLDAAEFHFKSGPIWSPLLVWQRGPDASELAAASNAQNGIAKNGPANGHSAAEAVHQAPVDDAHGFKRSWDSLPASTAGSTGLRPFQFLAVLIALDATHSGLPNSEPASRMTTGMAETIVVAENVAASFAWLGGLVAASFEPEAVDTATPASGDTFHPSSAPEARVEGAVDSASVRDGVSMFIPDSSIGIAVAASARALGSATSPSVLASATGITLIGGDGDDLLVGGDGDDALFGGSGNDTLIGAEGDDFLDGGTGADIMAGGEGDDTYVVDDADDQVMEADDAGTDTVVVDTARVADYSLADTSNVENLEASGDADFTGSGNALDNVITGAGGNDALSGAAGDDTIEAGDGDDFLDGGTGADIMAGGEGDDTYVVDDADDQVIEADDAGTDTVVVDTATVADYSLADTPDVENLEASGDADFSGSGNALDNVITGAGGNDALSGAAGDDTIEAGDGDDTLDGGAGADIMAGGDGDDTYVVDDADDQVIEADDAGTDTVVVDTATVADYSLADTPDVENLEASGDADFSGSGNALDNVITGAGGNDALSGAAGDDTIEAGDGDDTLDGGTGADIMAGGEGDDTYVVDDADDQVIEADDAGTDTVVVDTATVADYSLADTPDVENLEASGDADFTGSGNALDNVITGAGGDDTLSGAGGADLICGNGGDDLLDGGSGSDTLIGGDGNDTYIVDDATDVVVEFVDAGHDAIMTGLTEFTLSENVEDLVYCGDESFVGIGNDGDNAIYGGDEGDLLFGGSDNSGRGSRDNDPVADASAAFAAADSQDAIVLDHAAIAPGLEYAEDTIIAGGRRNDILLGNHNGNDTIDGGKGNDTIDGGTGDDLLIGGSGNDTFVFRQGFGSDVIADFDTDDDHDVIQLYGDGLDQQNWFDTNVAQVGNNVVVTMTETDQITLLDIDRSSLSLRDHFVFM